MSWKGSGHCEPFGAVPEIGCQPKEMQLDLDVILNPSARSDESDAPDRQPMEFHRRLPGYRPGPLISAPAVASGLGLGEVWVKDESNRFDLPAFKVLGASWAAYRALAERLPHPIEPWSD